jgi:hypothetical protein
LSAVEQGDPHAADRLLPLVYDELRRLAAQKLARERPGQTLQATALVRRAAPIPRTVRWGGIRSRSSAMGPKSIDRIFWDAAQTASAAERGAYLDRACAGDAELRRRVELLLRARSMAERFLGCPAPNPVGPAGHRFNEEVATHAIHFVTPPLETYSGRHGAQTYRPQRRGQEAGNSPPVLGTFGGSILPQHRPSGQWVFLQRCLAL